MEQNARPTWEEFWFTLALFYASRGTCDRLRTACLIVDENNRLIGAGYNGSLPGQEHCDDAGHFMVDGHCLRTLHAEDNALLNSTRDVRGSTAYVLDTPCVACTKKLVSKGVARILFSREYANLGGADEGRSFIEDIAQRSGVEFRHVPISFDRTLQKMLGISRSTGGRLYGEDVPDVSSQSRVQDFVLRIEKISPFAKMPQRAYPDDAGLDLFAAEDTHLLPHKHATVGTGLKIAVPLGYAGFVWDKSGIAAKYQVKTLAGVLDSNYRGELKVILHNLGAFPYQVRRGEKIAQLVITPIAAPPIVEDRLLDDTDRGEGGFGSTGIV